MISFFKDLVLSREFLKGVLISSAVILAAVAVTWAVN